MGTMNVSLPEDLIEFVREETRGGGYGNNSDVVRDGLRLLRERKRERTVLKRLLGEGAAEVAAGKDTPLTRADLRGMAQQAKVRGKTRRSAAL
jgi:antitoxin ParD1/3/4